MKRCLDADPIQDDPKHDGKRQGYLKERSARSTRSKFEGDHFVLQCLNKQYNLSINVLILSFSSRTRRWLVFKNERKKESLINVIFFF